MGALSQTGAMFLAQASLLIMLMAATVIWAETDGKHLYRVLAYVW